MIERIHNFYNTKFLLIQLYIENIYLYNLQMTNFKNHRIKFLQASYSPPKKNHSAESSLPPRQRRLSDSIYTSTAVFLVAMMPSNIPFRRLLFTLCGLISCVFRLSAIFSTFVRCSLDHRLQV